MKVCLVLCAPPPALRAPWTAARPSAGRGLRGGQRASEPASAAAAPGHDPAARMTARGAAGRCPPTVSDGRGAGSGGDGSSATRAALRTGCRGSPAAAAGYGCDPMFACRLRGGSRAPGLRAAAALQPFLGLRRFSGKGKAARSIVRRGTLSHPLARERDSEPRAAAPCRLGGSCLSRSDQLPLRSRRSGCVLSAAPSPVGIFLIHHTHMLPGPAGEWALLDGASSGSSAYRLPGLLPRNCWQKEGAGQASTCSRS